MQADRMTYILTPQSSPGEPRDGLMSAQSCGRKGWVSLAETVEFGRIGVRS